MEPQRHPTPTLVMRQSTAVLIALGLAAAACGSADESSGDVTAPTQTAATTEPTSPTTAVNDGAVLVQAEPTPAPSDPGITAFESAALDQSPNSTTTERFATFAFGPDGTAFECQLDGAGFAPCESPVFFAEVSVGTHEFEVRPSNGGAATTHQWEVLDLWSNPTADLIAATKQPDAAEPQSWRGIFRINCDFSHSSYNDPVVFPGDEDAAHLHRFYGNMSVDHDTTLASLLENGASTCQGNELNASGYWVPALLSPEPTSSDGWNTVPAVVGGDDVAHEVFYYSAGIDDLDAIQPIPVGLRMIAGDHSATPDDPQSTSIVRWHCQVWESNDATNPRFSATIPECEAPDRVRMDVFFPSCWNGVDLDSPDHQSHMAYPVSTSGGDVVCPDTHPTAIVRPSYHYAFGVKPDVYDPVTKASTGWRLSSDSYEVTSDSPGGASLHADWINGWDPAVMEAILQVCIQGRLDCHDGNLANGFRLGDVQEGVQNDPEVINAGLGHGSHDHAGIVSPAIASDGALRVDQ